MSLSLLERDVEEEEANMHSLSQRGSRAAPLPSPGEAKARGPTPSRPL